MPIIVKEKRVVKKIDLAKYNHDQIVDMLLCPLNRDMTRREHNCDDRALWENRGQWLIEHYVNFGGAAEWAKRRSDYMRETEEVVEREIPVWAFLIEKINPHPLLLKVLLYIKLILHNGSALCYVAVK